MNMSQLFLNVVVSVLIYLNYFEPGYVADTFGYCISCTYAYYV